MGLFVNQHVNHNEFVERRAESGAYSNCYGNNYINTGCCSGNYTFGSIFASMLPGLFTMGLQALDNDDSTTDVTSVTSAISSFTAAKNTYLANKTPENWKKLEDIYNNNKDNPTIKKGYEAALNEKINRK